MISLLLTYLKRDIQREASVPSRRKARVTEKGLFPKVLVKRNHLRSAQKHKSRPSLHLQEKYCLALSLGFI